MSAALAQYGRQLRFLEKHPLRNRGIIRKLRSRVQAIQETQRDVTSTYIAGRIGLTSVVDKNNYTNYEAQVEGAYKMYDGLADFGSEVLPAVADIRVAFIAGEGVSLYSENQRKAAFLEKFLKNNNLNGSKLMAAALMGELEGKALFVLATNKDKKNVDARLFSWYLSKYVVERDKADYEKILSITYQPDGESQPQKIDVEKSVYVKLGGSNYKDDKATTKLGKCLTQCENASRAAFDLRKNTHVFGKIMPYWETANGQDAKTINDGLAAKSFEIGDGYAGPAKMSLLEPSGTAADAVIKDMLNNLRYVAAMTGVPIHWLAWPELMSNRATAENMLEVVSASTKKERLIWEEKLTAMMEKVCTMAVDAGFEDRAILEDDITVKLPLISLASLQQLIDVWTPIYQERLISKFTFRNMLPGVDPLKEDELVAKEKKEAAEDSPFNNETAEQTLARLQQPPQQQQQQQPQGGAQPQKNAFPQKGGAQPQRTGGE